MRVPLLVLLLQQQCCSIRVAHDSLLSRRAACLAAGCAVTTGARAARAAPPQAQRRVLVAGASGRSGRECVAALREAGYAVVPLVRSATRWREVSDEADASLRVVEADLAAPDVVARLVPELKLVDDVICDVGFVPTFDAEVDRRAATSVDRDGVIALVEAAERADLRGRFVLVSSLLAGEASQRRRNLSYRMLNGLGGVVDAKRDAEARLRASEKLDWVVLRPGVFTDAVQGGLVVGGEDRFLGEADDGRGLPSRVSCKSPFFAASGAVCGITRRQLADAAVAAVEERGASRRTLEVVSRPDAPASPRRGTLLAPTVPA